MGFLYIIRNNVNSKVYVGITSRSLAQRWSGHKADSRRCKTKLYNAMTKYGIDQFYIMPLLEYDTLDALVRAEIEAIAAFNSYKNGYNSSVGGDSNVGKVISKETRAKMRQARLNKPVSAVTRARMRQAGLNKVVTAETRAKLSLIAKNRTTRPCPLALSLAIKAGLNRVEVRKKRSALGNPTLYTYMGKMQSLFDWKSELSLSPTIKTIKARIRHGWSIEEAFYKPVRSYKCQQY